MKHTREELKQSIKKEIKNGELVYAVYPICEYLAKNFFNVPPQECVRIAWNLYYAVSKNLKDKENEKEFYSELDLLNKYAR